MSEYSIQINWVIPKTKDIKLTEDKKEICIFIDSETKVDTYVSIRGDALRFLKRIVRGLGKKRSPQKH